MTVDELEDPPVDRLVGTAGLLDDKFGEQAAEFVVAGPKNADTQLSAASTTYTRARGTVKRSVRRTKASVLSALQKMSIV